MEGNSIRSASRLTGVHKCTVAKYLVEFGDACKDFLDARLRGLNLRHVQCDEIWTFVRKKQSRLTVQEREERGDIGDVYVWTALDQDTKLIASFAVGKRSADMARRFLMDLAGRLEFPTAHASDDHAYRTGAYKPIIQISTDGFAAYPEAVDLAFGPYVRYGQIIKNYRNARMDYTPSEMIGAERRPFRGIADVATICTSHVERQNLTMRTFLKRFNRLTLGFSKKLENLAAAVSLHFAHYNFCRRHGTLRCTPAMAAGVEGRLWKFADLYDAVMPFWQ